jgi:hypothetical protein
MRLLALFLSLLGASAAGAQVTYKSYYEGLPDLDRLRPFATHGTSEAAALRDLLSQARSLPCQSATERSAGVREICGSPGASIRELLGKMAKGLPSGQFSGLWLAELEPGQGDALLAQYDVQEPEGGDRYAAFFAF